MGPLKRIYRRLGQVGVAEQATHAAATHLAPQVEVARIGDLLGRNEGGDRAKRVWVRSATRKKRYETRVLSGAEQTVHTSIP